MPATAHDVEPHVDCHLRSWSTREKRVVAKCRKIDPRAELVYFGEGRWLLGAVSKNTYRQNIGHRMKKATLMMGVGLGDDPRQRDRLLLARLAEQGFRFIQMYRYEQGAGGPDERIVQDFARRDHNWRHRFDEELSDREDEIDGTVEDQKKVDTLLEAAEAKAPDIVKYIFRKARSFTTGDNPVDAEEASDG